MYKSSKWLQVQSKTLETRILNKFKTSPSFITIERLLLKDCVICWHDFGKVLEFDEALYRENKKHIIETYLKPTNGIFQATQ